MWALDRGAYEESKNEASRKGFGRCQMPISQSLSRKLRTRSRKLMNAVPDDTHTSMFFPSERKFEKTATWLSCEAPGNAAQTRHAGRHALSRTLVTIIAQKCHVVQDIRLEVARRTICRSLADGARCGSCRAQTARRG